MRATHTHTYCHPYRLQDNPTTSASNPPLPVVSELPGLVTRRLSYQSLGLTAQVASPHLIAALHMENVLSSTVVFGATAASTDLPPHLDCQPWQHATQCHTSLKSLQAQQRPVQVYTTSTEGTLGILKHGIILSTIGIPNERGSLINRH